MCLKSGAERSARITDNSVVTPGLSPGVAELGTAGKKLVDARAKPGHDDREYCDTRSKTVTK